MASVVNSSAQTLSVRIRGLAPVEPEDLIPRLLKAMQAVLQKFRVQILPRYWGREPRTDAKQVPCTRVTFVLRVLSKPLSDLEVMSLGATVTELLRMGNTILSWELD